MEKDGDASIAVIRRHESRLFSLLRCDTKCRKGKGAWFCPIVSRRIFEGSIATAEENGEIARLKIDDGHVDAVVAVEVASEPEIRSCVGAGIAPWLKRPITYSEKRCKAILLPLITSRSRIRSRLKSAKLTPSGRFPVR